MKNLLIMIFISLSTIGYSQKNDAYITMTGTLEYCDSVWTESYYQHIEPKDEGSWKAVKYLGHNRNSFELTLFPGADYLIKFTYHNSGYPRYKLFRIITPYEISEESDIEVVVDFSHPSHQWIIYNEELKKYDWSWCLTKDLHPTMLDHMVLSEDIFPK